MADPFQSAKQRISRAKVHIRGIDTGVSEFFSSKPFAQVIEATPKGWEEHKVKITKPIPNDLTDLAQEAIEALRASLDHAVFAVASALSIKDLENVLFPIAETSADFERNLAGRLKGFPADFHDLIRSFKPYKDGNHRIWALNKARKQGVHRFLVPVGTALGSAQVNSAKITSPLPMNILVPKWNAEKGEIVFIQTGKGSDIQYSVDLSFYIAFGSIDGVAGLPLLDTLEEFSFEVERIVLEIESKAIGAKIF